MNPIVTNIIHLTNIIKSPENQSAINEYEWILGILLGALVTLGTSSFINYCSRKKTSKLATQSLIVYTKELFNRCFYILSKYNENIESNSVINFDSSFFLSEISKINNSDIHEKLFSIHESFYQIYNKLNEKDGFYKGISYILAHILKIHSNLRSLEGKSPNDSKFTELLNINIRLEVYLAHFQGNDTTFDHINTVINSRLEAANYIKMSLDDLIGKMHTLIKPDKRFDYDPVDYDKQIIND